MSRPALAQRPPHALVSSGFSGRLQVSAFVRFEPDVVRARPPPSGLDAPTLPAYLQRRPAADAAKPPAAAPDAEADKDAKEPTSKDAADKDKAAKDQKDKAGGEKHPKGKAAADNAAGDKDTKHGGGAKGGKTARGAAGHGAQTAKAKKAAAPGKEDEDGGAGGPDVEEVGAASGSVELERDALTVSDPSHGYDGPTELTVHPTILPGAPKEKPDRDVETYAAVFAAAAAAARRLHDALIADATSAADAARAAASSAADRRQSELDQSLRSLDDGLAGARQQLASVAADALSLVDERGQAAEATIRQAAGAARGALAAGAERLNTGKSKKGGKSKKDAEATKDAATKKAASYQTNVKTAGDEVAKNMEQLRAKPETYYPYEGEPVAVAGIEAIVTRAPKRAGHRIEAYAKELTAQQAAMKASFDVGLPAAFNAAFKTVTGLLAKTNEQGPAAVDRATAAALKQLAAMRRQMRTAIRSGRARTDAALVRQHDAARSQTILAHQSRAKSETAAASRRAEQDITGLRALAVAQGASGRVLIDTFAKQTDRGEKPFAKAVVTASRGFAERVAATDTDQRPRLVASAAASIASGQQQSRAAGAGLVGSATAIGTQSGATAKESADALFAQANDTSSSYDKLAQPVSKSIQGYLAPVGDAFDTVIDDLNSAADKASDSVDLYYNTGHSGEKASGAPAGSDQTSAAPAENGKAAEPPKMIPKEYMDLALKVAGDPRLDTQIKDLADKAPPEITKMVQGKAFQIHNNANELHTDTNAVMQALRSITEKQGAAIEAFFKSKFGWELEPYLRDELPKLFSMADTDELNINAAISYLHGNNVEGALNELKAAINWTNETGRIEEIARSLTPAQWAELKRLHPEVVSKVSKELDGVDRQVFDALAKEGDTAAKLGKDPTEAERADPGLTENSGKGVAEANALRLRQQIGRDRETRGDAGADKVADDVERAAGKVVTDAISGADPVAALEEHRLDKIDVTDAVAARNEKQWKDTKQGFDDLEVARTGEAAPKGAKPGWSIAAYASQKKDYWIYVPDTEYRGGYGAYGGEGGPQGHYEKKTEGISDNQTRLIQNIVDYGPDSDEAAAAHVMVELNRDGGKPKPDRLDKAMHASDLDAREGENKSKLSSDPKEDADLKKRRLDSARERQQRVLGLVGQYQNPGVAGPWDPEAVRAQVKDQLTASEAGDPSAKALVERTMRGPAATWDDEQKERHDDAKAAFDYALAHEAERGDTLKRTFGRMDRQEITDSVDAWNAAHPGEDSLYKQLNLFGQGSWWTEKLSGDERNDVELAAKGIARNDKERAEIARFRADQQIRDAGFLGKLAGKVTGDWDRLVESRDDIGRLMGVPPDAFDAMGNALGRGNFDENGEYTPPPGGSAAELDVALNMTHLTAEAYKAMTDSLATAVATGLVVIAAVVTTALTGGAAAAFWVTLAAGLTGMALSAAIKGNRYSRAEAERDLVVTIVQATTAGLAAKASAALEAAAPALKGAATEAGVAEKALEGVGEVAARPAMSKGWQMVAKMGIDATSNAANSAAAAAMDPATRARGESGDKAFEAGLKGLFGGALGSLAGAPAGKLGGKALGKFGERVVGATVTGVTQRASDIGFDRAVDGRRMDNTEIAEELRGAAVQAVIQSSLEHSVDPHVHGPAAAAHGGRPPSELEAPGRRPPTETEPRARPPDERAGASRPPDAEPAPERPAARAPPVEPAIVAPAPEPIAPSVPSELAPVVAIAEKLRPPELAPVSPAETTARPPPPAAATAPEPVAPAAGRASDREGGAPSTSGGRAADKGGPRTQRKLQPGEAVEAPVPPATGGKRQPPPLPKSRVLEGPEALEGGVMMLPNSTSRAEIDQIYHKTIREDATREVAIYRNPETGEHILVFGNAEKAYIGPFPKLGEAPHAAEPAALRQEWKEILPADVGRWELQAHYHPGATGQNEVAPMWRRIPSSGERAGDLLALQRESGAAGGQPRASVIHFRDNGRTGYTIFGHQPGSTEARFWVNVENPITGARETHVFPDQQKYEAWAATHGATPNVDHTAAGGPSATPASGSPRPDEALTIRHGTSEAGAKQLAETGINPHRGSGEADDFSRGFHLTGDEPNAKHYAEVREGTPGGGKVIEVTLRPGELGDVVDVRPGGEHFDAWQEFLDRKPRAFPPPARLPPSLAHLDPFTTSREYGVGVVGGPRYNEPKRGAVFEVFLREKGLTEVDAIRGPLVADDWTSGTGVQPGEQFVIRSKRLANLLNERLGYPLIPEDPVSPGAGGRAGGPPETRGGPSQLKEPLKALPPGVDPAVAAREAAALAVDQRAIDGFRATHPEQGAKLDALLALAPEVVMPAIRGGKLTASQEAAAMADAADRRARFERGEPEPLGGRLKPGSVHREAALREALTAKGLGPDEIERQVENLRDLLKTPDQRVAEYRDAVLIGKLEPDEIKAWREFEAKKSPNQAHDPIEYTQADLVRAFAQALARSGGGVREFIGAVRELEAWKASLTGLDAAAAGAPLREISAEVLDAYRKLNPLKGMKPEQLDKNLQRAALRRLDSTEATKQLATEILSRFTGNPAEHAELLEAWESARQGVVEEPVLKRELADLTTVLTMPELTGRLKDKIDPYLAANVQSASPEAMARTDPVLLALAATNRAQFIERYVHMMRGEAEPRTKFLEKHGIAKFEASYDKRTLNAIDLRADIDKDMGSRVKSVASEATATFNVAKEMGLSIVKSDSTSKGETNQRGIDIVGVQPNPAIGPRLDQVRVHVFDDKAVAANRLGDVSALTENLAENLKRAAEGPLAKLAADEKAGLPVDPDHKAALAQMMAASKAIADIDARKLPKTGSKDSNAPAYQQLAYADAVAKVLSEHGIYLHITSEYGQVMDLAAWVKRYGFLLWDKQLNEPGGSISIAPPTPPPTPTPSPTPSPGP